MKESVGEKGEILFHISPRVAKFNIIESFVSTHNPVDVGLTELYKQIVCFLVSCVCFSCHYYF